MKKSLQIIAVALLLINTVKAQVSVNFEPIPGQSLSTKEILESQNWQFPQFDINPEGAVAIAGVQSIGHVPGVFTPGTDAGIVTPLLTFGNSEIVSFSYKLHRPMADGCRRWFTVALVDAFGDRTELDSVEIAQDGALVTYVRTVSAMAGTYAVYAKVGGDGCNAKLILDDFYYSGSNGSGGQAPLQKVSAIKNVDKNAASLSVFPNPANSNLNVRIQSETNESGNVEVYNMTGEKVISQNDIALNEGTNAVALNIQNLTTGNYIVTVKTATGVSTQRFSKM